MFATAAPDGTLALTMLSAALVAAAAELDLAAVLLELAALDALDALDEAAAFVELVVVVIEPDAELLLLPVAVEVGETLLRLGMLDVAPREKAEVVLATVLEDSITKKGV